MKFDNVFTYIGEYGRYQKLVTLSICSLILYCVFSNIGVIFITGSMDHYCKPADSNCSTSDVCWEFLTDLPPDDEDTSFINETQCRMYTDNGTELTKCNYGWMYDRSQYEATIVSEFDLVCEDSYKASLSSSTFLAGFFVGSILCGVLCDVVGRKKTIFMVFGLALLNGVLCGLTKSYTVFVISRFLMGATNIGIYLSVFTYATEIVGPSKRALVATLVTFYWCVGYMILPFIAYFIRSWNILLIVCNAVLVVLLPVYCFVPKSARWLIVKNRHKEAKYVLKHIAEGNNRDDVPDEILENLEVSNTCDEKKTINIRLILRYRSMLKRVIVMTINWFSITLVYYGLTYGVEGLNVNVYIGTFISGLTELFAYLFSWFVIQKFGRRYTLSGTLVASGIACFTNIWIASRHVLLRTVVSMIGKFFITSAFAIVYVFTVEIYPTDIRATGLGICSCFARIAGILAPQILFLEKLWKHLPLVTFSISSVLAGLLALLLPETLNVPLPQTIEEADMMTRKGKGGFHDVGLHPVES